MMETPSSPPVSTKQQRIAELARRIPNEPLTNLSHNIDDAWLREAWRRTRKDGAVGVDGQTAHEYEANLRENLWSLLNRAKSVTIAANGLRVGEIIHAQLPGSGTPTSTGVRHAPEVSDPQGAARPPQGVG